MTRVDQLRRFDWFPCSTHRTYHLRGYRMDTEFRQIQCPDGTIRRDRFVLPKRAHFK
jgi:hypothetical protein